MNLQQLKVFVFTVRYEKLYVVAKKLGIRQPTVTFHLNKLQESLGVPLFVTSSYHNTTLTEEGKTLYHYAKNIVSQAEEIESVMQEYRELKSGRISIGSTHTPATYIMMPYIAQLKKEFLDLFILLDVNTSNVIVNKIKNFELDFGIISEVDFQDEELIIEPLQQDDLVVVLHPNHPLANKEVLTPNDLSDEPMIHHEPESVSRKLFDQWAEIHGVKPIIHMETSGSEAMKEAVRYELGFGILSESIIKQEVKNGELCMQRIPDWPFHRQIYYIRRKDKLLSPAMRLFLERFMFQEKTSK